MKDFIHEIHRRSLWQVLGIYLAVSWIVLQVVDVVGNNFGLPEWVAPGALILLLIGLPIVVATAFVQEGMTTRDAPAEPEQGDERTEAATAVARESGARHRLFTWRNALFGGGAAFTLLGILTAGYLILRSSGVGPAGTLVAQGVLEEGAEVVLAEFESSDAGLADVVTGALRIDLVQSPTIRLIPRTEISAALTRMGRGEDDAVTSEVARELAVREGYGAVIEGQIGSAGSGYVLTASIVGGEGWTPLAAFRATADSEDELIDAIEDLSRDIRDKAGESLRTVRGGPGLRQVTTPSLEALRLYTRGQILENSDRPAAVELYERAVELDPEFGMAYRSIGVNLGNMGVRRDDQVAALTKAYELRASLPPAERQLAEAYYYSQVVQDRAATMRAYERLLEIDPENVAGLNNLAIDYREIGRLEEAEALLERALAIESFTVGYDNLARVRFQMGLRERAEATLDEAAERLPEAEFYFEDGRVNMALASRDYETAEALAAGFDERFPLRLPQAMNARQRSVLNAIHGRLQAAEALQEEMVGVQAFFAHPMIQARNRAAWALVRGDSAAAVRILTESRAGPGEALAPGDRFYPAWVPLLVEAGAIESARAFYREWEEEVPEATGGDIARDFEREMAARFALAAGDADESLRQWEALERDCGDCTLGASLGQARALERAGDLAAAAAEYERYLAHRELNRWTMDLAYLGPVLERLAGLYEAEGDAGRAAELYARFADLWAEADEELQPRVRAARARLEALEAGAS